MSFQYEILQDHCKKLKALSLIKLSKNLQDASSLAVSKPAISLQKSLLVLEEILYELYKLEMQSEPKLKNIRSLLNNRSFVAKIHPRRIYLLMNLVNKMTSNNSSEIVEAKAAKIVLDYISDIVEWFIERYDRSLKAKLIRIGPFEDITSAFDVNMLLQDDQSTEAYKNAASWFEFAAKQGNVSAQYNLGALYNQGRGVKKDYAMAKMWYERAAAQNDANALYSLGVLYHLGHGVVQNYEEAAQYYKAAANLENADAQYNLGVLYNQGLGMPLNFAEAAKWYMLAANQGNTSAQNNLGFLYHNGTEIGRAHV